MTADAPIKAGHAAVEAALVSGPVSLLDVVPDPEAITPSARFSDLMATLDTGEDR